MWSKMWKNYVVKNVEKICGQMTLFQGKKSTFQVKT